MRSERLKNSKMDIDADQRKIIRIYRMKKPANDLPGACLEPLSG